MERVVDLVAAKLAVDFPKMSGRIGQTFLLRYLYKDQSFLNSYLKS